jgi:phosphoglycolate phosphatase
VISGDTTPHAKPHPAPLLEAARRLDIDPTHCWYVGDDQRDIEAGRAAGMITVACNRGYCGSIDPATWGADYLLDTPRQLLDMLRELAGAAVRAA